MYAKIEPKGANMGEILVGINAKLTKQGAANIDLLVHSYYLGRPSPCVVVTNSVRHVIGGSINSLDQIFAQEVAQHPGYAVKERANLLCNSGLNAAIFT